MTTEDVLTKARAPNQKGKMTMTYEVRRIFSYGSNPWAIVNVETGKEVIAPDVEFDHPTLGKTTIMGAIYYPRKRDAQAVLNRLLENNI